jgi:mono/diheme cytochrome c family protein
MAESTSVKTDSPVIDGLLADFDSPDQLLEGAKDLRDAGYQRLDAYTPFPIHGLQQVLRIPHSPLPWLVLAAGLVGGVAALLGQWWTNAVDYPFLISGKPRFSLPANIPVAFEVIILLSAFAAFFGMLALNRLPRWHQPLLSRRRFRRATSHHFLLVIDAQDPRFSLESARQLMFDAGAISVEVLERPVVEPAAVPRIGYYGLGLVAVLALIPPLWIARARETTSELPRLHLFKDMDSQPKFKPQTKSTLFADRRAMRPPAAGTIARGELFDDDRLYRGIEPDSVLPPVERASAAPSDSTSAASETPTPTDSGANDFSSATQIPRADPDPLTGVNWTRTTPLPVTAERLARGRERFNIFCATCHGRTGEGDGLVSLRALQLEQGTWVPATSLHVDYLREQPDGQLYHAITHGVRKMPGYAAQISVEDRWSIVMYVRALQRSQNATLRDVPESIRDSLRDLN